MAREPTMANWLERARREFEEGADAATAKTANKRVSAVLAVGHSGPSEKHALDLAPNPPANVVPRTAIRGGDREELEPGRRDEGRGEFLESASRPAANTANTPISAVSAVARAGDSVNCFLGLAGNDPGVTSQTSDPASANDVAWRREDDHRKAAPPAPPSPQWIAPGTPVRCIDCQYFERTSHPRLGTCRANQPPPLCGMFWDTDRRACPAFTPVPDAPPTVAASCDGGMDSDPRAAPEAAIRSWLARIGETDPAVIDDVLGKCDVDPDARAYFLRRAGESRYAAPLEDDRRYCTECLNLTERGLCLAVRRGEMRRVSTWQPDQTRPWRCVGYAPGADDPDRRPGRERWPSMLQYERKQ
jgi:hypothetical protein